MKRLLVLGVCALLVGCAAATKPSAAPQPALTVVTRDEWGSKPQPMPEAWKQVPKLITIHHAGTLWKPGTDPFNSMRGLQKFSQTEKKWPDVPYHYIIAPDGRVFEGRDWHYQPESNTKYDLSGVLNIELMGNFEEQRVSTEQLRSTVLLIAKLCTDLKLDPATIRGHRDAAPGQTVCPGRDFYRYIADGSIRSWVEQTLRGEVADIVEKPELPDGPTTRISTAPATQTSQKE
ncbi:MAG: peptidoglycan recognition family protein [Tepidisphaeraceae bacterium]